MFITPVGSAIRSASERDIYQLTRDEMDRLPGSFTEFQHAVVAGDQFATKLHVRLYFQESAAELPQLLKDCRRY